MGLPKPIQQEYIPMTKCLSHSHNRSFWTAFQVLCTIVYEFPYWISLFPLDPLECRASWDKSQDEPIRNQLFLFDYSKSVKCCLISDFYARHGIYEDVVQLTLSVWSNFVFGMLTMGRISIYPSNFGDGGDTGCWLDCPKDGHPLFGWCWDVVVMFWDTRFPLTLRFGSHHNKMHLPSLYWFTLECIVSHSICWLLQIISP